MNGQGKRNMISRPIPPIFMPTSSLTKCVFMCSHTVMNTDSAALLVMAMLQVAMMMYKEMEILMILHHLLSFVRTGFSVY